MKYQIAKWPIRLSSLVELACVYAGCFLLAGFITYLGKATSESWVLERYLKFIVENQTAFILGLSSMAIVYHYQTIMKVGAEIRSRIIVGDRLSLIRIRYAVACSAALVVCFILAIVLATATGLRTTNFAHLLFAFAGYIAGASLLMGRKGMG